MSNQSFDFERACELAQIHVTNTSDELTIKTNFNPLNKSSIGSLIFLFAGIGTGVLALTRANDLFSMIFGGIIGFGVGIVAFLTILSQLTSYIKISGSALELRNRLRLIKKNVTPNHKVKMETRVEYVKRNSQPGSGSYFRIVELYISDGTSEHLILDYQLDEKHATIANQLGNELSRIIKERIKSL